MRIRGRRTWLWLAAGTLVLLGSSLVGCAGLVAVVRGTHEFRLENPVFAGRDALSSLHRGHPASAESLRSAFGEPDEILRRGVDREEWRYRTGLRFHGVALLLIVAPVPLLVPTGLHDTYLTLEDGRVTRVWGSQNADLYRIGCMIGPIASMSGDGGCFAKPGVPPHRSSLGRGELWLGPAPELKRAPSSPGLGNTLDPKP